MKRFTTGDDQDVSALVNKLADADRHTRIPDMYAPIRKIFAVAVLTSGETALVLPDFHE